LDVSINITLLRKLLRLIEVKSAVNS
jgi:hypothetical protein